MVSLEENISLRRSTRDTIIVPGWSWTMIASVGRLGSPGPSALTARIRNDNSSPSFKFGTVYECSRPDNSVTSTQSRLDRNNTCYRNTHIPTGCQSILRTRQMFVFQRRSQWFCCHHHSRVSSTKEWRNLSWSFRLSVDLAHPQQTWALQPFVPESVWTGFQVQHHSRQRLEIHRLDLRVDRKLCTRWIWLANCCMEPIYCCPSRAFPRCNRWLDYHHPSTVFPILIWCTSNYTRWFPGYPVHQANLKRRHSYWQSTATKRNSTVGWLDKDACWCFQWFTCPVDIFCLDAEFVFFIHFQIFHGCFRLCERARNFLPFIGIFRALLNNVT